jgi:hypothetical protein
MKDQDTERLLTRARELMAESELSWRDAWLQAEDELGPDLGLQPRSRFRASARFNVLWVTAGFLFALVPGVVSQVVAPRWMVASSPDQAVGGAVYLALLALSGLAVAVIGLRFELTGRSTEGGAAALRMYPGVVFGTSISVMVLASGTIDVGLAAGLFGIFISIPYWACAALSLGLGSVVFRLRSDS